VIELWNPNRELLLRIPCLIEDHFNIECCIWETAFSAEAGYKLCIDSNQTAFAPWIETASIKKKQTVTGEYNDEEVLAQHRGFDGPRYGFGGRC
jgi:hypothetical protein